MTRQNLKHPTENIYIYTSFTLFMNFFMRKDDLYYCFHKMFVVFDTLNLYTCVFMNCATSYLWIHGMCVCVCVCVYIYTHTNTHTHIYIYIYMYICMYVCTYVRVYVYMYVSMYLCML